MVLSRVSARWASRGSQQSVKTTRNSTYRRSWQFAQKRGYATAGEQGAHSTHKSSSDLPWAIGSIVVTVPSVWYLIQPQLHPKKSHGHGHGDEGHSTEHGKEHGEDGEHEDNTKGSEEIALTKGDDSGEERSGEKGGDDEGKSDEREPEDGGSDEEKGESSGSEDTGRTAPATPSDKGPDDEAHETEDGGNVEGVQFKGATSGGTKEGEQGDTRKHIPDAKGGSKKRIESDYGKKQGEITESEQLPENEDKAAPSKPAGKAGSSTKQSSKQEGISNTDTKHSLNIGKGSGISQKGDGMPDSAKSKGTVDPFAKPA